MQGARWFVANNSPSRDRATGPSSQLYCAGSDIKFWDLEQRRRITSFGATELPWISIACSRNGRFLAGVSAERLVLFDLTSLEEFKEWPLAQKIADTPFAISSDGRLIACEYSTERKFMAVYDRDSSGPPQRFSVE